MNIVGTLALHFDEFCEYMRQLVPTRGELVIGGTVGTLGMVTNLLFGGWNDTLTLLALFMAIDYVTGVMAAGYTKKLSSKKGLKGIKKKIGILAIVAVGHGIDVITNEQAFCLLMTFYYVGNEGVSILENVAVMGVPVPTSLVSRLKQVTEMAEHSEEVKRK